MRIAPVKDVQAQFGAYLKTSEEGPIVITRGGRPVAILLSMVDEGEIERLLLAYSPKFQGIVQAAKQQIREGQGIPHQDFWQEVQAEPVGQVEAYE